MPTLCTHGNRILGNAEPSLQHRAYGRQVVSCPTVNNLRLGIILFKFLKASNLMFLHKLNCIFFYWGIYLTYRIYFAILILKISGGRLNPMGLKFQEGGLRNGGFLTSNTAHGRRSWLVCYSIAVSQWNHGDYRWSKTYSDWFPRRSIYNQKRL